MHFFIALSLLMNFFTNLFTSRLNKHYSSFSNSRFSSVSNMMHYFIALFLLISTNRMFEFAFFKFYSFNFKTIASRKRKKNWREIEIKMYNARIVDSIAISKTKIKLKQTAIWMKTNMKDRKTLENNEKNKILDERMSNDKHDNAIE